MGLRFLQIGDVAINPDHIETVDGIDGSGLLLVHFESGNDRPFDGNEAVILRSFFSALAVDPPVLAAPVAPEPEPEPVEAQSAPAPDATPAYGGLNP